ncbi:hypothetical protein [Taibaiella koreensis]|uniref:hypothetical protein n=1 Tax=Taibaiella koreensis TaxID=1268548 RepID=UPI000E59C578|nr:hypothetical protein [Taibaiella koreensis]
MDFNSYLEIFQDASRQLDEKVLIKKNIDVAVGVVLNSVFLKLYKRSWSSPHQDPLTAESRIFFSIWVNQESIDKNKLLYNVHALKLRKLPGYTIQSNKFAAVFRAGFKEYQEQWPNVSVSFGPLTLMQGWLGIEIDHFQFQILNLANSFLEIESLIDKTLFAFKQH